MARLDRTLEDLPIAVLSASGGPGSAFAVGNRNWRAFAGDVSLEAALHPDDRESAQLSIRTGLIVVAEFALDARLRHTSGSFARHSLRFSPSKSADGTVLGWLAIATDIDAIVAAHAPPSPSVAPEITANVLDFRNQMAGIIGHDLRNPLSTLVMGTALLRARLKTEPEQKLVDRLIKASDRMTRMIAQLVDYTSLRLGGGLDITPEPGDLAQVVRHAVEEIAHARGVTISIDTPETVAGDWDATRLEQVVTNLVLNAIIHGAPQYFVSLVASDIDAIVEVRDQGPALDQSVVGQLFTPTRKRISATREAGSLGLGLYVTEQIVQAHGGRITARSTSEGTVFRVELPRTARTHDQSSNPG